MTQLRTGLAVLLLLLSAAAAMPQSTSVWQKDYPLTGEASLAIRGSVLRLVLQACPACQSVHIRVSAPRQNLAEYLIAEEQKGNSVRFSMQARSKPDPVFHPDTLSKTPEVFIDLPAKGSLSIVLDAASLSASGLQGYTEVDATGGLQTIDKCSGTLKLHAEDGDIHVLHASGTIEASTVDGDLEASGIFSALLLQTTDGSSRIELLNGSRLEANSQIRAEDGTAAIKVPRDLAANLDIAVQDGNLTSTLPITLDGFNGGDNDHKILHGKLNGGGPTFTFRVTNGNLNLEADK